MEFLRFPLYYPVFLVVLNFLLLDRGFTLETLSNVTTFPSFTLNSFLLPLLRFYTINS